ncbi:MAG: hypothetical protein Q9220_004207 [cf. Caloplaca sp. 1 TL-2023]
MARKNKRKAVLSATKSNRKGKEEINTNRHPTPSTVSSLEASPAKDVEVSKKRLESPGSADVDARPSKRLKTNSTTAIDSTSTPAPSSTEPPLHAKAALAVALLPAEVQHLRNLHAFSTMSIISSSKISQKVRLLLSRIEGSKPCTPSVRPSVVILKAKAASTSKMISVVEIAKADMTKRGRVWYQYTQLRSEILPYKAKRSKRFDQVRPSIDKERQSNTSGNTEARLPQPGDHPITADAKDIDVGGSNDEDGAFEVLQQQPASVDVGRDTKIRATPTMNIYLSCVRIPDLESLLG